jgi:DNA-binding transcriptional regulator GbsR (MarR family)
MTGPSIPDRPAGAFGRPEEAPQPGRPAGAPEQQGPGRDPAAVLRFIERFASNLVEAGMARMPARVFVALLVSDSGRLNAAEVGEALQVSPAAVSGAVRYLMQINLVSREREPGSRRDNYRVHDDAWHDTVLGRDQLLARWDATVREGVEVVGSGTPAGQRLELTRAFFEFLREQLPALLSEWQERRAKLREKALGGE